MKRMMAWGEMKGGSTGVARIFFGGAHFFLKKLMTFLVVVLNKQAKTAKLTTPTL